MFAPGLAALPSGYDQSAINYWRRVNAEQDQAAAEALGKYGMSALPGATIPQPISQGGGVQAPQPAPPPTPGFAPPGGNAALLSGAGGPPPGQWAPPPIPYRDAAELRPGGTPTEPDIPNVVNPLRGPQGQPQNFTQAIPPGGFGGAPSGAPPGIGAAGPAGVAAPPVPQGPPQLPQGPPPRLGSMTWEGLAGQIAKANPGISPAVLARAVSMAQPWLTAQATQDWRAIEADIQRERNRIMEEGIRQRPEIAQIGATSRETVVGMRPEVRAFQDYLAKNPDASPQDQAKFIQSTKGSGAKSATATMAQKWWDEHPEGTVEDFQRFMEEPKDTRQRRTIESREGIAARGLTERAREFDTAETRRVETETARAEIARKRLEANRPTPEDKHVLADMLAHYRMGPENLGRGQYRAEVLAEASEIARKEGYVYDQSNWRAHQGTISAFTYGKQGQQMRSIAAVDAHLGSMEGLIPLLQNNDARSLNAIKNWISANVQGAPEVTNFNMARQIVANELGKALAQSGGGALADRLAYEVRFDVNSSPPQLGGAIKTARKLMRGQIDSFRGEYNSAAPGMMDSFDKRFPWLGNIGGAAKKAPAAKPAEKPATESKWGPVIIEGPGAEEQSKAAPTTPGGRAPPAGGPEFKDRFEGGGEGASPFDESTRRGPGLDAFYAIAARHGAEGEKIKSTAVDVLKHPQEYIQPGPTELGAFSVLRNPKLAARVSELIKEGLSSREIASEMGIGHQVVQRHLQRTGEKTASMETPIVWSAEDVAGLKKGVQEGLSQANIAKKLGKSEGAISNKLYRLEAAGQLPEYQRRDPYFWESTERVKRLKELVAAGYSQYEMARDKQLGARTQGQVSEWIKQMQERGEIKGYSPKDTKGLTAAGRTPTMPKLKVFQQPTPAEDLEYEQELRKYLRSKGLTRRTGEPAQYA